MSNSNCKVCWEEIRPVINPVRCKEDSCGNNTNNTNLQDYEVEDNYSSSREPLMMVSSNQAYSCLVSYRDSSSLVILEKGYYDIKSKVISEDSNPRRIGIVVSRGSNDILEDSQLLDSNKEVNLHTYGNLLANDIVSLFFKDDRISAVGDKYLGDNSYVVINRKEN